MQEKKNRKSAPDRPSLTDELANRIRENGPITVAEFMGAAASYYYANKTPFGEDGDFTTAPEISQMFGEMIGAWLVDVWMQMGQPERIQLIELGPGRGTLMADIMRTVSAWPDFKSAVSIHLIETSPQLRQAQATALKSYRPTFYDSIDEVAPGVSFIVANEFFDALPIHQFKKVKNEWRERCVDYDDVENAFSFTTSPLDFDISSVMPEAFLQAHDGCIFEVSPASLSALESIARRIAEHGGAALLIDYGHLETGLGDTLQSVFEHRYSDALEAPGSKDITAHVDFATFKTVAAQWSRVHGAVTQGEFLTALGIEQRAESLAQHATDAQRTEIALALKRLTGAGDMGRLFKVMGLTPLSSDIRPAGFKDIEEEADEIPNNGA